MIEDFGAEKLPGSWREVLSGEFGQDYFASLMEFLDREYRQSTVYPPRQLVFNALIHTPLDRLRVVILGQDPYHRPGQAHGLAFSVPAGQPLPPSLKNIFKEVSRDVAGIDPGSADFSYPPSGSLIPWADQGVLLLNTVLTVREGQAGSHRKKGWERFTNRVVELISAEKSSVVFMLWGNQARARASPIDTSRHLVLEAPHPSPLARGFAGCGHFSRANRHLESQGDDVIPWLDWLYP